MEKAQQLMDAGEFAGAEEIYRKILDQDPANTEARFMLALARQNQGDLKEALDLMLRVSEQEPENAHVHCSLGTLFMARNSSDEARQSYFRALQCDPFNVEAHNGVAFVELVAGNWAAAENAANMALNEDPRNAQALLYMGTAKLEQDDATKSISYLQEAIKEAPGHHSAQMQLGRAFMAAGNPNFAMQCFQNVIRTNAESSAAWEHMAAAQYASGYVQEAAENFRKAISLGRDAPATLAKLAACEQKLGNEAQAKKILRAAEASKLVASAQAAITRAELKMAQGNPKAALKELDGLEGPSYEGVLLLKARAYEQLRNPEAALEILAPLVGSEKASNEARFSHVRLLSKTGREEEADQLVETLLEENPPPLFARVFRGFQLCRRDDAEGIEMLQDVEGLAGLPDVDLRRIRRTLAETLDRAGRFDEAAEYYSRLTGRLAQILAVAATAAHKNRDYIEAGAGPAAGVRDEGVQLPQDPVFMFAWPGSGWEWLASGLGAHPDLMLVADKPVTQMRRRALVCKNAGQAPLDSLSGKQLGEIAGKYWSDLASGGLEPGERRAVDTMWLSCDMLPTLARLFPSATVVVVSRDPREMVLDWFRAGYSDLQEMAAAYRDQLQALERYRELVDLDFVDVDGEALQQDAVDGIKKVLAALGLAWDDSIATHLDANVPEVRPGRGGWSDYREVLADALGEFASGRGEQE